MWALIKIFFWLGVFPLIVIGLSMLAWEFLKALFRGDFWKEEDNTVDYRARKLAEITVKLMTPEHPELSDESFVFQCGKNGRFFLLMYDFWAPDFGFSYVEKWIVPNYHLDYSDIEFIKTHGEIHGKDIEIVLDAPGAKATYNFVKEFFESDAVKSRLAKNKVSVSHSVNQEASAYYLFDENWLKVSKKG